MNLRRLKTIAWKEFIHIIRDPRSLTMALAIPLLMLILFGYALSLDVDHIPTLIYDADKSPESRELIEKFQGSRFFQIIGIADGYKSIESKIDKNECLMGVIIPQDYSRNILSGKTAEIQLLIDGSDSNTAAISLGYVEALIRMHTAPSIEGRVRVWYNSELKSRNYIVPGLIAYILMVVAVPLTSLTIAREWEMGTMEQLLSTPLKPIELILGKVSALFTIGFIDMMITVIAGVVIFHVPLRGSPLLLLFTGCVFLFGALCWGIFISTVTRSQLLAYQIGMLTSMLPSFLLSGFIYAIENMPLLVQGITYIVPARYLITVLRGIFLKGAGFKILWFEIVLLLLLSSGIFILTIKKFKQKIA
ncbi:MAG: hypothetical protein A3I04_00540 [Nitrospinae bacterium RIFCSPLOWO2_02_FULL_39_110]|nr:MAG: hypothetical protein A2W53_05980 [Nitrospinae bacterium RIFCSPHIGHO2_02_39_11]OGW00706.1 MAG: hypothetical protein A3D97_08200 [Nitrospinae bacterium RIFCSPHIGHO2_12_FULL_39_42]OGW02457.1 MAG: hypothetical protein A3D20_05510 [Nitrospinae bacterium RIFCSPHIGHO2_02_FULL_39_82]OGW04449.1 MAG: hypothetical protein A2Z59_05215 [Nitrospinae bacterium RIFCSPLOWO2_02_39_17]OGW06427.1 MAG: hypothetical protein A3I04_00540 [Nitrospinae bacterium RIFCSPLOWO2_02_FULL_39_110]OGW08151.1 MAG: hypoth